MTSSRLAVSVVLSSVEQENELVSRLKAGDTAAFDEIFQSFNHPLVSFLTRLSRNRPLAEDLVEETWLRLVAKCDDFNADTRLGPWLFTVARNLYISHCRSRAREESYTADLILLWPSWSSPSPLDSASLHQFEERLDAALASLTPMYREVVLLVAEDQLRPMDAAKVIGISPESFRQRLSRARGITSPFLDQSRKEATNAPR